MFPELFTVGSFSLRTLTVVILVAFFFGAFVLWRKSREEHYPEDQVFDMFLVSSLLGAIGSRVGYILFNFDQFGFSPLKWVDMLSNAGFNGSIGMFFAGAYIFKYAKRKKWDSFEMLDFWMIAISLMLAIVYIGQFLDGSGVGYPTTLPVGVTFPGLFEPVHPVQLYHALFFVGLYIYLSRVELEYRNFQWYRSGKKSAQTGFLLSTSLVTGGIFFFILSFLKPASIILFGTNMDQVLALIFVISGSLLLYHRSGRPLPFTREKKKQKKLAQRLKQQSS
ncbi:MAG: prolipoprotein diacylglyceryl transferase [Pseudomonadales bacterium]|nr:prolipoprotein diacylglyceryl transferase [Pseudomonadales bacterium]